MSDIRRSFLQSKILICLDEKPAKTIAELSTRVNSQRPSVSRSLKALKEQNLVVRIHGDWRLTDSGRKEADAAKAVLAQSVQAMAASATYMISDFRKSLISSLPTFDTAVLVKPYLDSMNSSLNSVALDSFRAAVNHDGLKQYLDLMNSSLSSAALDSFRAAVNHDGLLAQMQTAIAPILEAQKRNHILLADTIKSATLGYLGDFASKNNLLLAHITDNMFELRRLTASLDTADVSQLIGQTARVNLALDDVLRQSYRDVLVSPIYPPGQLSASITVPTLTVAHYSDAVASYVHEEFGQEQQTQGIYRHEDEYENPDLDPLLNKLKPDFVEMRRGSWSALASGSYDRLRHAATSQRELIRQVFVELVPDVQLPDLESGKPHVRARVKAALGESKTNAEFATTMAEAVLALYSQLNKYTHHNEKHELRLRALLQSGEGLLLFILSAREP